jgi:hypothetical protein
MAEPDFERRLERLFAEPPRLAGEEVFAQEIARRLDRGWMLRRWLVGAAGVAGGLIGATQLVYSGVFSRLGAAEASARAVTRSIGRAHSIDWLALLPADGGVVWTALGLAVVLTGFVVLRVIEEI